MNNNDHINTNNDEENINNPEDKDSKIVMINKDNNSDSIKLIKKA